MNQSNPSAVASEYPANWPRTQTEALRDLRYLIRLNAVHARLFGRLERSARLLELIGGSAALAAVLSGSKALLAVAGVLVATVAYANIAFDFGAKERRHRDTERRYVRLRAAADDMTVAEIDRARADIEDPSYIEGLRLPSYNDMLCALGLEQYRAALSPWQRFMRTIA